MKNADLPAMPIELNGFGQYAPEAHTGLTKREMFAMHMMASCIVGRKYNNWSNAAIDAIEMADALLEELEKTNEKQ